MRIRCVLGFRIEAWETHLPARTLKSEERWFVVSHPWRKNNDAPRMGHPIFVHGQEETTARTTAVFHSAVSRQQDYEKRRASGSAGEDTRATAGLETGATDH